MCSNHNDDNETGSFLCFDMVHNNFGVGKTCDAWFMIASLIIVCPLTDYDIITLLGR